jgi:hypothetical protein
VCNKLQELNELEVKPNHGGDLKIPIEKTTVTCPICELKYAGKREMLRHMFLIHYVDSSKIQKHKGPNSVCKICKKQMKNDFGNHFVNKHMNCQTCPMCGASFDLKLQMLNHLFCKHAIFKECLQM